MSNRHSRQSFLGQGSEERLQTASAAVIGLCGGGSHVSQQLAHIGVGNRNVLAPSNRLQYLEGVPCEHFVGTEGVGDIF